MALDWSRLAGTWATRLPGVIVLGNARAHQGKVQSLIAQAARWITASSGSEDVIGSRMLRALGKGLDRAPGCEASQRHGKKDQMPW
jgi:hypothetical protein